MKTETKIYLTKKDLELIYGLKLSNINRLMQTKELIFYKIGRNVRFKREEVDAFFEQNRISEKRLV